jgi:hypothetical protein
MRLSVVVTIVDGGETLARCLAALLEQESPPPMDVIVPYDSTVPAIPALAARFPQVAFLELGAVRTARPPGGAAGQHELFDRRRAAGLAAASGDVVAILEDRGVPDADWAATVVQLHGMLPHRVIGGAVENGRDRLLNWAVYLCDFGRYQLPFEAGPREYVTDVNVSYKREALARTAALWRERYHEPIVHGALVRAGDTLFLSPAPVVRQMRDHVTLGRLLAERLAWGRLFAATRVRDSTARRRILLAALSPVLPLVLLARAARNQIARKQPIPRLLALSPALLLLLVAWSAGEAVGYLTRKP